MTPFAHRDINTRASLVVVVLLVAIFFGLRNQGAQRGAGAASVQATVVAAEASGTASVALPTILVELPGGMRVRLPAGNRSMSPGEVVTLRQTPAADGSRRYQLQRDNP
jgi:hypothetical protein